MVMLLKSMAYVVGRVGAELALLVARYPDAGVLRCDVERHDTHDLCMIRHEQDTRHGAVSSKWWWQDM